MIFHAGAACGAAFLLAVLWFDLIFDVQCLRQRRGVLPETVLASIAAYYRRVTTEASPMGRLVTLGMLAALACLVASLVWSRSPAWIGWVSLAAAGAPMVLASLRTVPAAVRLGGGADDGETRTRLARQILVDHLFCLAGITLVLALQLCAVGLASAGPSR
jgi:hypothetical protein